MVRQKKWMKMRELTWITVAIERVQHQLMRNQKTWVQLWLRAKIACEKDDKKDDDKYKDLLIF